MESRAIARDADVGEDMSVLQDVECNCYDVPGVFVHNPSLVQQFHDQTREKVSSNSVV